MRSTRVLSFSVGWQRVFGMGGPVELRMRAPLVRLIVPLVDAIPPVAWG